MGGVQLFPAMPRYDAPGITSDSQYLSETSTFPMSIYRIVRSAALVMSKYVLIVDDDPDARELLEEITQSIGFEARSASDGLEALNVLRHAELDPPCLILLDLMMPSMDGFSVYNWLRGNPTTRRVPVIVVTAVARGQVDMLRLPGVAHVIQKGQFTISTLSNLIASLVQVPSQTSTGNP